MTSLILPGELIIDDDTKRIAWDQDIHGYGTGWEKPESEGYGATADEFPSSLLINPSEFQARIEEREATRTQLSHKMLTAGLKCKDQARTNFCFANAPVHCVEVLTVLNNQPYVELSAASVACRVTGFRNVGGWAKNALDIISSEGIVPVQYWPVNQINRQFNTKAIWRYASPFCVDKWTTGIPRNLNQVVSLLLQDVPVAVAFNWWGHEVTAYDAIWLNGRIALRCRNSWGMGYGSSGFFILQGSKMYPDDVVAPLSIRVGMSADLQRNLAV